MGSKGALMYGFGQVAKSSRARGDLIRMQATPNDGAETEATDVEVVKTDADAGVIVPNADAQDEAAEKAKK